MYSIIKELVALELTNITGLSKEQCLSSLELPKGQFGDLASTIAFEIAKKEKKSPVEVARDISKKFTSDLISKCEARGPYINFYFSDALYSDFLTKINSSFGSSKDGKKVIVEFPSVNPNKPWHAGHLRNAVLGDSIARIMEFRGYKVERMDYIDDLGLQVAQSLWSYLNINSKVEGKLDHWLGKEYVKISKKAEVPAVNNEIRLLLEKLEEGADNIAEKGRKLAEDCVKAQYETAFALGIYHDVLIFESDVMRCIFNEGMDKLKSNDKIMQKDEGENKDCYVFDLGGCGFEDMKSSEKILIRSDGTVTYTGKDIVFHLWKFGLLNNEFLYTPFIEQPNGKIALMTHPNGKPMDFDHADMLINVIGVEQKYPQKVVKEILKGMGYTKEYENYIHLSHEHVVLPEAKLSGRKGTWIGTTPDELIEEGKKRALEKTKEELDKGERVKIAESVGRSAIRFSMLKVSNDKKIVFNWDTALNMKGDSAPYLMYAYVRCNSILDREKEFDSPISDYNFNDYEKALIKQTALFEDIVEKTVNELEPHLLCDYLLDVVSAYNQFYSNCKVLNPDEPGQTALRLQILKAVKIVLSNGFDLLGIERLGKM